MTQRFAEAVRLLMSATDHLEKIGGNESLLRELDSFIRSVHPLECGPLAVSEERRTEFQAIGFINSFGISQWEPGREPEKGALLYRHRPQLGEAK